MTERAAHVRLAPPLRAQAAVRRHVRTFVRQFRIRLRDRRFWVVQILVIVISIGHSLLEATHRLGALPDLALLPVSTYFIPVVYAALNFGVEGAVPTALWCSFLTAPNLIFWHSGAERPGVVLQLALLVAIAWVIARRVDFETAAKKRAEAATARLARLNRTAAATAQSLDLERVLSQTVEAMLDRGKSQRGWILLASDGGDGERITSASTADAPAEVDARELAATRSVIAEPLPARGEGVGEVSVREHGMAIVPLSVSGRVAGAVGVASIVDPVSADDEKLLETVANQLGVALGNIRHFRQTQLMVTELSRAQAALEEYVRLATDAQEEERKRLARELHDDTIQTLVVAKAELDALAAEKPSAAVGGRLKNVDATLTAAIDDVRRFSRDLRPSLLDDLGLVHAIDWLVADLSARAGINAQLRTSGEPRRLAQKDELALFRIVQEALHNVERHAEAKTAKVRLHFGQDVRASVIDNGCGFDPSRAFDDHRAAASLGLLGMQERAKLAGAVLSIKSRPSSGTRVTVTLGSGG